MMTSCFSSELQSCGTEKSRRSQVGLFVFRQTSVRYMGVSCSSMSSSSMVDVRWTMQYGSARRFHRSVDMMSLADMSQETLFFVLVSSSAKTASRPGGTWFGPVTGCSRSLTIHPLPEFLAIITSTKRTSTLPTNFCMDKSSMAMTSLQR